uniref:Uncharacterized protein n=1 Tax=Arundo donax TaxID=35708 RepID=A0A0A8Z7E4_ARUDO
MPKQLPFGIWQILLQDTFKVWLLLWDTFFLNFANRHCKTVVICQKTSSSIKYYFPSE